MKKQIWERERERNNLMCVGKTMYRTEKRIANLY